MSRLRFGLSTSSPSLRSPASARSGSREWLHARESPSGASSPPLVSARTSWDAPLPSQLAGVDAFTERLGRQIANLRDHVNLVVHPLESKLSSVIGKQPMIEWQMSEFGGSLRALQDELKLRAQQWDAAEVQFQKWRKQIECDLHSRQTELQRELGTRGSLEQRLDELECRLSHSVSLCHLQPRAQGQATPREAPAPAQVPAQVVSRDEFLGATELLRMELRQLAGTAACRQEVTVATETLRQEMAVECARLQPPGPPGGQQPQQLAPALQELAVALRREMDASAKHTTDQLAKASEAHRKGIADTARHVAQVEYAAGELFMDIKRLQQDFVAWKAHAHAHAQPERQDVPVSVSGEQPVHLEVPGNEAGELTPRLDPSLCASRLAALERQSLETSSSIALLQKGFVDATSAVRGIAEEVASVQQRVDALAEAEAARAVASECTDAAEGPREGRRRLQARNSRVPAEAAVPGPGGGVCVACADLAGVWLQMPWLWGLLLLCAQDRLWSAIRVLAAPCSERPSFSRSQRGEVALTAGARRSRSQPPPSPSSSPASPSLSMQPPERGPGPGSSLRLLGGALEASQARLRLSEVVRLPRSGEAAVDVDSGAEQAKSEAPSEELEGGRLGRRSGVVPPSGPAPQGTPLRASRFRPAAEESPDHFAATVEEDLCEELAELEAQESLESLTRRPVQPQASSPSVPGREPGCEVQADAASVIEEDLSRGGVGAAPLTALEGLLFGCTVEQMEQELAVEGAGGDGEGEATALLFSGAPESSGVPQGTT